MSSTRDQRRTNQPRQNRKAAAARPRGARLAVESLEDRVVPAVINVNSLADVFNPGPGTVTLRSAIQQANTDGDATNVINLTLPGTYRITLVGAPGETDNVAGEFAILPSAGNLTIRNTSHGQVAIDGNHLNRVFDIDPNFDPANPTPKFLVTLQGVTVENGVATDVNNPDGPNASGGGIRDNGNASLTLTNVVVTNNTATADGGGVVFENLVSVPWTFTVNNSVLSNNHAGDAGGGIDADGSGTIFINAGTVISGNTCLNQGAGIWLDAIQAGDMFQTANLTVTGAVVSGNTAQTGLGGGIGNAGNGTVTIRNSTLAHNSAGMSGGGFGDENAQGTLVVHDSLFRDNLAVGNGGGIAAGGPLTQIVRSEIDGNSSAGSGGGVFANGITLNVLDCTLAGNTAAVNGGGLEVETIGAGQTGSTISNSTIAFNSALNTGGGNTGGGLNVTNGFGGSLLLVYDTINGNVASTGGGVNVVPGAFVSVVDTIVAGNVATALGGVANIAGPFTDLGGNLNSGDPLLGPLANNGGPTVGAPGHSLTLRTEALLRGSPARGRGILLGVPGTDERGLPRVVHGRTDIGAFQTQGPSQVGFVDVIDALFQGAPGRKGHGEV
jgi:hypothetical protein